MAEDKMLDGLMDGMIGEALSDPSVRRKWEAEAVKMGFLKAKDLDGNGGAKESPPSSSSLSPPSPPVPADGTSKSPQPPPPVDSSNATKKKTTKKKGGGKPKMNEPVGTRMICTPRAGLNEIPNAVEIFFCWRTALHNFYEKIEAHLYNTARHHEDHEDRKSSTAFKFKQKFSERVNHHCGNKDLQQTGPWGALAEDPFEELADDIWIDNLELHRYAPALPLALADMKDLIPNPDKFDGSAVFTIDRVRTAIEMWNKGTEYLFGSDVQEVTTKIQVSIVTLMCANELWEVLEPLLSVPDHLRFTDDVKVSPRHLHWILDQSATAEWRGTECECWDGNGLMLYPMRVLSDRATTSAGAWLMRGLTPLAQYTAASQERPTLGDPPAPAARAAPLSKQQQQEQHAAEEPAPAATQLEPGTRVFVVGLVNAPQYNDEPGTVECLDEASGRFSVRLTSGGRAKPKVLAVRRENLKLA